MQYSQINLHFGDGDALRASQFDGFVTVSLDGNISVSMFFRTIAHAKGVLEAGLTALAALEEPVVEELTFREEPAKNGEMMLVCSKCGNGNFPSYPDSYHCIHYKQREAATNDA